MKRHTLRHAEVSQGSVVGPMQYNTYSHDIPKMEETEIAQNADNLAIITKIQNLNFAKNLIMQTAK